MKKLIISFWLLALFSLSLKTFAIEANNDFELNIVSNNWEELIIDLFVINPSNQKVASVQSWLEFDGSKLKWKSINTNGSPFDFVIPWESNFDKNIIKIWRSTIWWDTSTNKIFVAKITFEIVEQWWTIEFYDYQSWDWWHVSIQVFDNWFPVNTLKWKPNGIKVEVKQNPLEWTEKTDNKNSWQPINKEIDQSLERPKNPTLSTSQWSATIKWDLVKNAENYYVYYWKVSWRYLNRRQVWKVNTYLMDGLENWAQYFFWITAVSKDLKESDYSDEVAVIIWKANSSTSPMITNLKGSITNAKDNKWKNQNKLTKNDKQNSNKWINNNAWTWPSMSLILSAILSIILSLLITNKIIKQN